MRHTGRMSVDEDDPQPGWAEGLGPWRRWRDGGGETLFENPWLQLTRHAATAPTGAPADYVVMRPRNLAAGVLPLHDDGTVTLVGQHRFATMRYSWEMPEGGVPPGEDSLTGVQRELAEEAGLTAAHWRQVLELELSNSITDERALCWLAWGLSPAPIAPDPTEDLRIARVPFRSLIAEIERGTVRDVMTVATALKAHHMARGGRLPAWLSHGMLSRVD